MSDPARRGARAIASIADRVRPPPDGVVILLYHRVGAGTGSRVDLPVEQFRSQMSELAASGRAVSLATAIDILSGHTSAAHPQPVVVTFDDGTGDFADNTVPILVEFEIPATLYAATAWIETNTPFWNDGTPALSWAALADVASTDFISIGSHTHDHVLFDRISSEEASQQITKSCDLIGDRLGIAPLDFAYPKALAPTPANRAVVAQHFRSATLAGTRPNPVDRSDLHELARSPIVTDDVGVWFTRKLGGGMGVEDRLRRGLDRVRYRGRTR